MADSYDTPLAWLDDELVTWESRGLRRTLATHGGAQGPRIVVDGHELVNFGSNDYLSLAADPRVVEAAEKAARREGWGSGASPLVTGRSESHARLEKRLAEFKGTEAALVFSSGFAANVGTIAALVERGDAIFADRKNHASLIDGCRLSKADVHIYPHLDCARLESLLRESGRYRRRLIVTDSLFSMDGDLAPLAHLAELAARFDAMLMVDEAHATGIFGQRGRGVAEFFGVEDGVHIRMGTLSKALGSVGGFVAGTHKLIDWLTNRARSYVFSTAPPAAAMAAAHAAIDIVRDEPQRRRELLTRGEQLREQLRNTGWQVGNSCSQIIPVLVGAPEQAMKLSVELRQRGYLVPGIRPPSVPEGESLLRISLTYGHSEEMATGLVDALRCLKMALGCCQ